MKVHWTRLRREGSKGSEGSEGSKGKVLKMDGPSAQGFLRYLRGRFLGLTGPMGRRVLKFDGPSGRRLWYRPAGDKYKVSVTGFTFSVIWYDKHSADWLAALATPYPAAPDFPLCRGQNKVLKSSPFISSSQHNGAL